MYLAVLDDRKERSARILAVDRYLNALNRTAEALRLGDMDVVSGACDRNLNVKLGIVLPEERLDSQTFSRELNAEALEK